MGLNVMRVRERFAQSDDWSRIGEVLLDTPNDFSLAHSRQVRDAAIGMGFAGTDRKTHTSPGLRAARQDRYRAAPPRLGVNALPQTSDFEPRRVLLGPGAVALRTDHGNVACPRKVVMSCLSKVEMSP